MQIKYKAIQIKKWIKKSDENVSNFRMFRLIFFIAILITLVIYRFSKNFPSFNSIFTEWFGLIFDVILLCMIFSWLQQKTEKKKELRQAIAERQKKIDYYKNEIDDYRGWDEKEAMFRIRGNIIRLNKLGVTKIKLDKCYLKGMPSINELRLEGASLFLVHLEGADLSFAHLERAKLISAHLEKTNLMHVHFERANLGYIHFEGANLSYANLKEANLLCAHLEKTNLMDANLEGVKNLKLSQLSKVKTLYNTKLDPEIKKQVQGKYPHLLEHPDKGRADIKKSLDIIGQEIKK